jgi:hypothetical protein
MEFWEGAVLVVGGLWLVNYMSHNSRHGANPLPNANLGGNQSGLTQMTNTAGASSLVVGEPLAAPQPTVVSNAVMLQSPTTAAPVSSPLHGTSGFLRPVAQGRSGARRGPVNSQ